jgi:hypothetical protein
VFPGSWAGCWEAVSSGARGSTWNGLRSWPRHDRQLTVAAEQARRSARNARESLRWNLRAKAERAVPRPDGAVLDSLEELTARTRAVARSLPEIRAACGPGQNQASFGQDYAVLLRNLAGPVRELADLRSSPPRATLTAASDGQHQLERETAQLPGHSDARRATEHLARLTSEIISEVTEHQGARDDPAGHRGKFPGTLPRAQA